MAILTEKTTFANDTAMQANIRVAMVNAATQVLGEAIGVMTPTWTLKRQTLAKNILDGGGTMLIWAMAVSNQTIADITTPTDTEIANAVSGIWDDMAGVFTIDKT